MSFITDPFKMASKGSAGDKISDLQRNMRSDDDNKARMTSDFGVRQYNTDDWLKVVNEDQTGPALLEDAFGREKVRSRYWYFVGKTKVQLLTLSPRSIVLTTRESPRG